MRHTLHFLSHLFPIGSFVDGVAQPNAKAVIVGAGTEIIPIMRATGRVYVETVAEPRLGGWIEAGSIDTVTEPQPNLLAPKARNTRTDATVRIRTRDLT
jgi:hypothetical protein